MIFLDYTFMVVQFTPGYFIARALYEMQHVPQPSFKRAYVCGKVKENKLGGSKIECCCVVRVQYCLGGS